MSDFEKEYKKLNPQQKEAVDTVEGPVMVIAGPGTGKTQVLTLRIANILKMTDARPENILALTFTDNAAANMRQRLSQFLGAEAYKIKICTFHSFCNDVISNYPEKFNFRSELDLLDDLGSYKIIRTIIDSMNFEEVYAEFTDKLKYDEPFKLEIKLKTFADPYFFQKDILDQINQLKKEYISPDIYKTLIFDEIDELNSDERKYNKKTGKPTGVWKNKLKLIEKNIELYGLYREYQKEITEQQKYDFNDMINFVVKAFQTQDDLLAAHQEKFLYILVDEYQDSNGSQNEIINQLGSWDSNPNIFVVGDEDQSIYRFQGANIANIIEFKTNYPGAKLITLTENYRSTQQILDFATQIITHNKQRLVNQLEGIDKDIKSTIKPNNQPNVNFINFSREEIENYWIVKKISELNKAGTALSEIAVLYKNHKDAGNLIEIFNKFHIKTKLKESTNLLEDSFITNIISIFKIVLKEDDNVSLYKLLSYDFFEIRKLDIFKLIRHCSNSNQKLIDLLLDEDKLKEIQLEDPARLNQFAQLIVELKSLNLTKSFLEFTQILLSKTGILNYLKKNKNYEQITNLNRLINFIKSRNSQDREYDLQRFINDLEIMDKSHIKLTASAIELKTDAVNLMTGHASKGLQFEYVFIPNFTDKKWSNNRSNSKIKLINIKNFEEEFTENEEERRLLYVVSTRAKSGLYICKSDEYISGDLKMSTKEVCQYLTEIPDTNYTKINVEETEADVKAILELSTVEYTPMDFKADEKAYLESLIKTFRLSATSLNDYISNPQDFLFKHILKVSEPENKTMVLGSAIHKVMEFINRKYKNEDLRPSLEEILKIFNTNLQRHILSNTEMDEVTIEGEKIVTNWYKANIDEFKKAIYIEYSFGGKNIHLDDIPLTGKIDKVEKVNDNEIRIIDYKTGSPKSKSQIVGNIMSKDTGYYRQMLFYQLLFELDPSLNQIVSEVELNYVKPQNGKYKKLILTFTNEEIIQVKELIRVIMGKIRNLEF
ncbi:ATP-dependent helicase [Candidatus Dojkabacteria bacterium]|nr:ATP-dependent helicase [Candidatus Dojkabacteria bacterium]